ncbi:MAG: ATP-binding protein, partial [Cyanobacteria bacterium J06555_13]
MSESANNRIIRIEESAVGSAIVSGDGNTIYVIQQATEQKPIETDPQNDTDIGPNPYKGLSAFKEADADRYFGREVQIERLWKRFQALYEQSEVPRVLPILGPSGCGKSSLARAGFIPELARQPFTGKEHMRVAVLVPGARPLEALAGVLAKAVTNDPFPLAKAEEFELALKKPNSVGGCEGLRRIANLIPDIRDTPLVILVDQFEEVYSLCKDLEQRQAFIDNLLHAASEPTGEVSVVITLRSDFWGETQRHEQLNQAIGSDYSVNVPAMTATELRRAIKEPAKQAGQPLDEATIELLVKETEGREGALPLLQFSLEQIWDGLSEGNTPAATYRSIGGVGGAIAGKAKDTYDRLKDSDQMIARRVFVGLVQLGEGARDTRRRVKVDRLIAKSETPETVMHVIRQFSASGARLITLSSNENHEMAEVTHE